MHLDHGVSALRDQAHPFCVIYTYGENRQQVLESRLQEQRANQGGARRSTRRLDDEDELEEQRERLDTLIDRLESVLEGVSLWHRHVCTS